MRAPRHGDTQTAADEFEADAKALGLSAEMTASVKQAIEQRDDLGGEGFGLWPASARVIERLMVAASQWRVISGGFGGLIWLGLDYVGAKVIYDGLDLDMTADDWRGLRMAEATVAAELNSVHEGSRS